MCDEVVNTLAGGPTPAEYEPENYAVLVEVTERYPIIIHGDNDWDAADKAFKQASSYRRPGSVKILTVVNLEPND